MDAAGIRGRPNKNLNHRAVGNGSNRECKLFCVVCSYSMMYKLTNKVRS
jgi:hypothetical protein